MKDEFQKTIDDLSKKPTKRKVDTIEKIDFSDIKETMENSGYVPPNSSLIDLIEPVQPIDNSSPIIFEVPVITIALKDSYLPNSLVKAGLFKNNAEARQHIRKNGVLLNGRECFNTDATNHSENFEVEMDRKRYQFFLI